MRPRRPSAAWNVITQMQIRSNQGNSDRILKKRVRGQMKERVGLLIPVLLFFLSARGQDSKRDGNWWRSREHIANIYYMTGFLDGTEFGHRLTVSSLPSKDLSEEQRKKLGGGFGAMTKDIFLM